MVAMRRYGWLTLGLVLALAFTTAQAPAADAPAFGTGPAYETIGRLPVQHAGRVKPFDTFARQMLKQIHGYETLRLTDSEGKVEATWGHVGAVYDFLVRPEFWDGQPIIRVDSRALKSVLLAEPIKKALTAIADKPTTSAADKAQLQQLAGAATVADVDLSALLKNTQLPGADRDTILAWAAKLSTAHKWLSPLEIENARVTIEGKTVPFDMWLADIASRSNDESAPMGGRANLPELDKKAFEVGIALRHYQALRGDSMRFMESVDLMFPRPHNATYLKFLGEVQEKLSKALNEPGGRGNPEFSRLEEDSFKSLDKYLDQIPRSAWKLPGTDGEFDAKLAPWMRDNSAWVPLGILLQSDPQELERAGFPYREVSAFREKYETLSRAEEAAPGRVAEAPAAEMLQAARTLGEQIGGYPTAPEIARETYFNAFSPFYKSSIGYGLGMLLLLLSLGIAADAGTSLSRLRLGLYSAGMAAFLSGIALEIYGFYFRVRISGWAPVTNMYETVIWVALVVAVIGLVLEMIYRRGFIALAASGVAFFTTTLAYKVSLLDPNIKNLSPVLRSNYWLTIHVLTEVSSYAAFALAMGLGLIGTFFYLTATYRRPVGFLELVRPLVPGLPLLALGSLGLTASYMGEGPAFLATNLGYTLVAIVAGLGGMFTITALGAMIGEAASRLTFREKALDEELSPSYAPSATSVQTVTVGEASGAVATLSRPTVAEIRARAMTSVTKLSAREQAMQATAAKLKALTNYIYRTIQVGVMLIIPGTMLGGLWADVSWGRFWGWDPKEVWALITLLVYLIPLHGRFAGWIKPFGLVVGSVVCFLSVVMAWYGVNFVLGVGLHSYGFSEGGGQGVVSLTCAAVLALVAAAAWRRSLAHAPAPSVA
jgi:ABC-type transport system involved in cytochrome c biogenesis permease subunit